MKRLSQIAVVLFFLAVVSLALVAVAAFGETRARIAVPEYAVAHGSVVRVSDLLPATAGEATRERAEAVVVGESPAPGNVRNFSRERIEAALRGDDELERELDIPPVVHVTRWARMLSSEEVLHAVERSLEASKLPEASLVASASVTWAAPVYLASEASLPEAMSVDLSAGDGVIRARIWIPSEPRVTPFWVELWTPGVTAVDGVAFHRAVGSATSTHVNRARRPILMVQSGKTVTLVLSAPGMQISTNAAAMQSGGPGDQVRVRVLPSGKQFVAKVVGPSEVEAGY